MDKFVLCAVGDPYFNSADMLQPFLIGYKADDNHEIGNVIPTINMIFFIRFMNPVAVSIIF